MDEGKRQKRPRRSFTDDFKAGAVRLVLDEGKTIPQVGRDLDLTESALRTCPSGNRNGLNSLQRGSGAHARNGRDPAVDQEVCPDDVRRIVRREVDCQLRDFQRIGHPLAWIVGSEEDRKSTRLNSSHRCISYAVFCLKKKTN